MEGKHSYSIPIGKFAIDIEKALKAGVRNRNILRPAGRRCPDPDNNLRHGEPARGEG